MLTLVTNCHQELLLRKVWWSEDGIGKWLIHDIDQELIV
jgi:hypothetical protein